MRNIPISIVNPSWLYRSEFGALRWLAYITVLPRYFVVHKCFLHGNLSISITRVLRDMLAKGRVTRTGQPFTSSKERTCSSAGSVRPPVGRGTPPGTAPEFEYIRYETIDDGRTAAITLDRLKQHNAQTRGMLVELGASNLPRWTPSGW